MNEIELKPCPFCGSKPFLNGRGPSVNGHMKWQVGCDNEDCPVHDVWGAGYDSDLQATTAWNTREAAKSWECQRCRSTIGIKFDECHVCQAKRII